MRSADPTRHAMQRLAQRGLSISDCEWATLLGREVEGGLFVLDRDAETAARRLEHEAQRVRRLGGIRLVIAGDTLVTAYPAGRKKQKRLVRGSERRNLVG